MRLVADRAISSAEEARLGAMLIEALGHPFKLQFNYFDRELPQPPNGKFESFVCAII